MSTEVEVSAIEDAFEEYIQRKDIAILLINQHVRNCVSVRTG